MMGLRKRAIILGLVAIVTLAPFAAAPAGQVLTKCHISCRCLCDDSIANFLYVIPVDKSPDIGYEADLACKAYGHRICYDCCNGLKFSYTYQIVSP